MGETSNDAAAEREDDGFSIGGKRFHSRLIVGSGKYKSFAETRAATVAAEAEMITVAVRRVNITDPAKESLLEYLGDLQHLTILPNTAGCYTVEDCLRTARLAREAGVGNFIKVEVIGDEKTLYPDNEKTVEACRILSNEGFICMPYITDDPITARKCEDAGAQAVMPLASPIGSGLGIQNEYSLSFIIEQSTVPVVVDAGVGTASDAARCLELGAAAVLTNSAIALAQDPVAMAKAMKLAVRAGRLAYLAGRMPMRRYASASSPETGLLRPVGGTT
ncbi:MAG: thiazole synthase [Bdellovibrionales bacterium]|nr:thiazole synthase [Bdellovibrionales bacterium]